jgi:hypothetical protein
LNLRIAGRRGEAGGSRQRHSSERAQHRGVRRFWLVVDVEDQRIAETLKESWYPGVFVGEPPGDDSPAIRLGETELRDVSVGQRLLLQFLPRGGQADPDVHLGDGNLKPQSRNPRSIVPVSLLNPERIDLMHLPTDAIYGHALIYEAADEVEDRIGLRS